MPCIIAPLSYSHLLRSSSFQDHCLWSHTVPRFPGQEESGLWNATSQPCLQGTWAAETSIESSSGLASQSRPSAKLGAGSWNLAPVFPGLSVITVGRTIGPWGGEIKRVCDSIKEPACWNIPKAPQGRSHYHELFYCCFIVLGREPFGSTFPARMQARESREKKKQILKFP